MSVVTSFKAAELALNPGLPDVKTGAQSSKLDCVVLKGTAVGKKVFHILIGQVHLFPEHARFKACITQRG